SAAVATEENALVTVAELARSFRRTVVLLSDDPVDSRRALGIVGVALGARVEDVVIAGFSPWRAWVEMLRCRLLFHTASYLAAPRPRGRRTHIALAHGTSPKYP